MRRLVLLLLVSVCLTSVPAFGAPAVPDTPAGRALGAWLDAFNSGDRARIARYHAQYEPKGSPDETLGFRRQTGGFDLLAIDRSDRLHIDFRVQEKAGPRMAIGQIVVKDADPPQIVSFELQALPPGMNAADVAVKVDAALRTRVIDAIVARLTDLYVFPDTAKKMVAALRAHQQKGEYEAIDSGYTFASQLTEHLRAVAHDKHLGVRCVPMVLPKDDRDPLDKPPVDDQMRTHLERDNCGFEKVERLDHNIGYVKLNFLAPPAVCGATATAAMGFLAHVDAIIFDLRDNHGGSPEMVAWLTSYLFDARTHLNDLYERKRNKTTEFWTRPDLPGKKLAKQPVYVLTSTSTFSGAEEFAYNLKNLKRATIVGQPTGGGAHPTAQVRLDDHFIINLPFARAINPISKSNWEGKGVEPDVKVATDEALDVAKKLALEQLAASGSSSPSANRRPRGP